MLLDPAHARLEVADDHAVTDDLVARFNNFERI
jgi:hypothetical protein